MLSPNFKLNKNRSRSRERRTYNRKENPRMKEVDPNKDNIDSIHNNTNSANLVDQ